MYYGIERNAIVEHAYIIIMMRAECKLHCTAIVCMYNNKSLNNENIRYSINKDWWHINSHHYQYNSMNNNPWEGSIHSKSTLFTFVSS